MRKIKILILYKLIEFKRRMKNSLHTKYTRINTSELFYQHNRINGFTRYDIIVRLLAVECYYDKNKFGFDYYYRMQTARTGKEWAEKAVPIFKDLIKSYETQGYDAESQIELDSNLNLIDGSHRIALALYYKTPSLSVKIRPYVYDCFYSIEWFHVNGFSDEECNLLIEKYKQLKKELSVPFIFSLWHPAHEHFNDITKQLSLFGKIGEIKDFKLTENEYKYYTRGIYAVDDIAKWKIEMKLDYMLSAKQDYYSLRMVALYLEEPIFRIKQSNNSTLSEKCELIKKLIREGNRGKVDNYFHDIIIHIGDNFYQNMHIYKLLTMPHIDLNQLFRLLSDKKYVITKVDVPYMPLDFPDKYPLGKDLDIVCDNSDYLSVVNNIKEFLKKYEDDYKIIIHNEYDEGGEDLRSYIRLEQEAGYLVLQFDISTANQLGKEFDFINEMISNRILKDCYYIPNIKHELLLRIVEVKNHPEKKHHSKYIMQNLNSLDTKMCDKYLNFNWKFIINNLKNSKVI